MSLTVSLLLPCNSDVAQQLVCPPINEILMAETANAAENEVRMKHAVLRVTIAADDLRNVALASKNDSYLEFHRWNGMAWTLGHTTSVVKCSLSPRWVAFGS